jgi:hypothetical protein
MTSLASDSQAPRGHHLFIIVGSIALAAFLVFSLDVLAKLLWLFGLGTALGMFCGYLGIAMVLPGLAAWTRYRKGVWNSRKAVVRAMAMSLVISAICFPFAFAVLAAM